MTQDIRETLKLALEALEYWDVHGKLHQPTEEAITAIKEALAQEQEPVAWQTMEAKYPTLEKLDIRMGDGSILCSVWPQNDGDLWWEGSGTGEKFMDPKYANVTHWRVHSDTTPPQRTEQEPVALETLLKWDDDIDPIGEVVGFIEGSPYIMVKVHKEKQVSLDDDLYATPPQRSESSGKPSAWVGLTDEEIAQGCKESWVAEQAWQSAVWWAEDKLRNKNT
jgi:hypothetical protein